MTPEKNLVEMETNYPRLEQPDFTWIKKFFWKSLGITTGLSSLIWILAAVWFMRTGQNPFDTDKYSALLEHSAGDLLSLMLILLIIPYTIFTTVQGALLALKSHSIFTHWLPRAILLGLQGALFWYSISACAWLIVD